MVRGPRPKPAAELSGYLSMIADSTNSVPPSVTVAPGAMPSRSASAFSATRPGRVPSPASASASGMGGSSATVPIRG